MTGTGLSLGNHTSFFFDRNLKTSPCLLLVMCTYPFAKKELTLHLARGEGRERYFGCNLMQRKVLASSHQHLMAEAPGFLVLNAHLGKRGIFDFDLASSRYLIASVPFVVFLVCWYIFAGREIIFGKNWLSKEIALATRCGLGPIWKYLIFIKFFARLVFFTCLSAAFFSHAILGNKETEWVFRYLIILFLIACPWDFLNFDLRFPRTNQVFELTTKTLGIFVFFTTINFGTSTMLVFLHFAGISLYVNFVLDSLERFKITADLLTYDMIYTAVLMLLLSTIFGVSHYGRIISVFGGGQLQRVEIMIDDQTVRNGLKDMGFEVTSSLKAELVHENHQEFIVDVEGQTIRLPRKIVAGIKMLPVEDSHWLRRYLNLGAPVIRKKEDLVSTGRQP